MTMAQANGNRPLGVAHATRGRGEAFVGVQDTKAIFELKAVGVDTAELTARLGPETTSLTHADLVKGIDPLSDPTGPTLN